LPVLLARLDGTQVGFTAEIVREIVRAVEISPLLSGPAFLEGVINLHGCIVPVLDLRERLGMTHVAVAPEQYLIAMQIGGRLMAVRVDDVEDIAEIDETSLNSASSLSPSLQGLRGIAPTASGTLVIYDADAFLTQAEAAEVDVAVKAIA
jgi:purine-binding chemotaxis protein CheW